MATAKSCLKLQLFIEFYKPNSSKGKAYMVKNFKNGIVGRTMVG